MKLALNHQAFDAMVAGAKTIEGRGAKGRFLSIRPGDTLTFMRGYSQHTIQRRVVQVVRFDTFREMVDLHHAQLTAHRTPDELVEFYERTYPGVPALAIFLE